MAGKTFAAVEAVGWISVASGGGVESGKVFWISAALIVTGAGILEVSGTGSRTISIAKPCSLLNSTRSVFGSCRNA